MLSLIARAGEVGDLILPVAMMFQLLDGVEVEVRRLIGGGQTLGGRPAKGGVGLDLQEVGGNVAAPPSSISSSVSSNSACV